MDIQVVNRAICPECHSETDIIKDEKRGELICSICGIVLEDRIIDQGPEWRVFSDEHDVRIRAGTPPAINVYDKGMSTYIEKYNKDANDKKLSSKQRSNANRIRKWHNRLKIITGLERNISIAMSHMNLICSKLGVSKTIRRMAAEIYRSAVERKKLRVREIKGTVVAAVYIACRKCRASLTLSSFKKKLGINRKKLNKDVRKLREVLQIENLSIDPKDFVARYCSELKLSMQTQMRVFKLLSRAKKSSAWTGKNPVKSLGGIIYIASILEGERRTQREIANICEVSEVTVRNRYKAICEALGLEVI